MQININGVPYDVPAEEEIIFLQQLQSILLREYDKLDANMRFLAKPAARGFLQKLENEARAKHGKEQALIFRPDKKQDAVVHLSGIMVGIMREALKHVTISVGTADHTIAAFKVGIESQSTGRGSVAVNGNIGFGQDDSTQVS